MRKPLFFSGFIFPVLLLGMISASAFAQTEIDTSRVSVAALITESFTGPLDGKKPVASFLIKNEGKKPINFSSGIVSIACDPNIRGELWTQIGSDGAFSSRIAIHHSGSTEFVLPHFLTLGPGQSKVLHFYLSASVPSRTYHNPMTLAMLHVLKEVKYVDVTSGSWKVFKRTKYSSEQVRKDLSVYFKPASKKITHPKNYLYGTLIVKNRADAKKTYQLHSGRFAFKGCSISTRNPVYIGGPAMILDIPGWYDFAFNQALKPGQSTEIEIRVEVPYHKDPCDITIRITEIYGDGFTISRDLMGPDWPMPPKKNK